MKRSTLEQQIAAWKKALFKHQGLEPSAIEELEDNLRDRIADYQERGYSEEEAFRLAKEKAMPDPVELADEYYKARTNKHKTPPWRRRASLFSKAPMHFKIAVRNLAKRRVYAILNIMGLAVSIAAAYLIWLYVQDQSNYDQHFDNAERIYRVIFDVDYEHGKAAQADVGQPVGPTLKADFPEVIEKTRTRRIGGTNTLAKGEVSVESTDFFVTDEDFFKVFSVELSSGNKTSALTEPNTVVISEDLAVTFFGHTDVVGEVLRYSGLRPPMDIKITGVMKDLDPRTHLPFQALISYSTYFDQQELINWLRKSYTYILLNEQNDIESLRSKIPDFNKKYLEEVMARRINAKANLLFQPLTDIYLDDEYLGEPYPHGNRQSLNILTTVMIFLLVMACINYINLATARSVDRAAEVGIRKTLGSSRKQLLYQFISEAILIAMLAGILGMLLAIPVLPYYTSVTGILLNPISFFTLQNIVTILLLAISIGLVAGICPAFYLTTFQPHTILKGKFSTSRRGVVLRKSLIVTQYTISAVLIIWILVVSKQIHFMKNRDVGFDKASLIELTMPDEASMLDKFDAFIQQVRNLPNVRQASKTTSDLSSYYGLGAQLMEDPDGLQVSTALAILSVGYNFVETIGAEFVEGRDFDSTNPEERAVLINQAAVEKYGWQGRALEAKYLGRDRQGNVSDKWKVVGVVSDFKLGESYEEAGPIIFYLNNRNIPEIRLMIGIEGQEAIASIPDIARIWERSFEGIPFEYELTEYKHNALYWQEETFMNLLTTLCGIIVFITALGIIGLISFTTELRKKEIALRKVCGARIQSILVILSRQFVALLVLALLIAVPLGYFISDQWLTNFSIHIPLSAWPFALAIPVCFLFTALALVYHALQAARSNPVDALRSE